MLDGLREQIGQRLGAPARAQLLRLKQTAEPGLNQLRARYQKLESRERILVKIAGVLIALLIAYNVIYVPIRGLRSGLADDVVQRQHELVQVRALTNAWLQIKNDVATAHKRTVPGKKDFSLFSVVEKTLTRSVGHDKLGSIIPAADKKIADNMVEHRVDLELNNLTLAQVVNALYGFKQLSVPVTVSSVHIKRRSEDPHTYDVDMTCVALGKSNL
ncbi:MAG: type II secretion system protein GspM [Candidatus Binataceae bacterium]